MKIKSPIGFLALWSAFLAVGVLPVSTPTSAAPVDNPTPDPFFGQRPVWFKPIFTPDPEHKWGGAAGVCVECVSDGFSSGGLCFNVGDGVMCGHSQERCVTVGQTVGVSGTVKVNCGDGVEQELGWTVEHTFTEQKCESVSAGACQVCFMTVCYNSSTIRTTRCRFSGSAGTLPTYRHDVRIGGSVTWGTRCWGTPSSQPGSEAEADAWACELCATLGHDCDCEHSQDPPMPPDRASELEGLGAPVAVHCVIDIGLLGGDQVVQSVADLSLPELATAYAQLLSASSEHSTVGESARYYLQRSGALLASGTAVEIAVLIDLAATRLVHSSVRGDLDGDGVVTSADIMVFIEALGGGHDGTELPIRADLNADLELDAADLMIVLESLDG